MVQEAESRWRIETDRGIILTAEVIIPEREAEDYIKRYISSYYNWTYEMVYLRRKNL
jgi:hypothetical protein